MITPFTHVVHQIVTSKFQTVIQGMTYKHIKVLKNHLRTSLWMTKVLNSPLEIITTQALQGKQNKGAQVIKKTNKQDNLRGHSEAMS
jgi:hypothetical protein